MTPRLAPVSGLRRLIMMTVVAGASVGLTACSSSGVTLAREACSHVNRSIALYTRSLHDSPKEAGVLQEQAYLQLRFALPIAAQAATSNAQWQALMTTLSETNRVSEHYLLQALRAQCGEADSSTAGQPTPPTTGQPTPPTTPTPQVEPGTKQTFGH
ncbi:MAG: hypothetical protein M0Z93_10465 [Actinomycetota bacterium]|nr:hypothetical protein [Actinomycetota bacterium]